MVAFSQKYKEAPRNESSSSVEKMPRGTRGAFECDVQSLRISHYKQQEPRAAKLAHLLPLVDNHYQQSEYSPAACRTCRDL